MHQGSCCTSWQYIMYLVLLYDCHHLFQSKWWFLLLSIAFSLPCPVCFINTHDVYFLPDISLATCAMLLLLYSVRTFQFPIFMMCLGCTSGLLSSVASCWLWPPHIIELLLLWGTALYLLVIKFCKRDINRLAATQEILTCNLSMHQ